MTLPVWLEQLYTGRRGSGNAAGASCRRWGLPIGRPRRAACAAWPETLSSRRALADSHRTCSQRSLTAGSPDRVLANFERFVHSAQESLVMFRFLAARPRAVEMLVRLFSGSQFLAEILLRNPEYFEDLIELRRLAQPKSREKLILEARHGGCGHTTNPADQLDALRRFQRWETAAHRRLRPARPV